MKLQLLTVLHEISSSNLNKIKIIFKTFTWKNICHNKVTQDDRCFIYISHSTNKGKCAENMS